jgi:flagellar hook-basal body complex protein FliE
MAITPITSLPSPFALQQPEAAASKSIGGSPSSSFGDTVRNAVDSLDASQKNSEKEIARAVAGESPDLHRTIIALQTADLNFQFGLQVRNKLVGAYEEIMRMQV